MLYVLTVQDSTGQISYDLTRPNNIKAISDYAAILNKLNDGCVYGVAPFNEETYRNAPTLDKVAYALHSLGIPVEFVPCGGVSLTIIEQIGI